MPYYAEYERARRVELRALGLCVRCKADSPERAWCPSCVAKNNAERRAYKTAWERAKREAMRAQGCPCGGRLARGRKQCSSCRIDRKARRWRRVRRDQAINIDVIATLRGGWGQ